MWANFGFAALAASRVKKLAAETPAIFIVFDLLAGPDGRSLLKEPLEVRRAQLENLAAKLFASSAIVRLSPATTSLVQLEKWVKQAGPALDGIIAKRCDLPYRSGERTAAQKIKNYRSAD